VTKDFSIARIGGFVRGWVLLFPIAGGRNASRVLSRSIKNREIARHARLAPAMRTARARAHARTPAGDKTYAD